MMQFTKHFNIATYLNNYDLHWFIARRKYTEHIDYFWCFTTRCWDEFDIIDSALGFGNVLLPEMTCHNFETEAILNMEESFGSSKLV